MRDEIMEIKKEIEEVKEKSLMLDIVSDYKKANRRQFIVILVILTMWFASIGLFIYYINTTGYEVTTETAETNDSGNACVGDNCNNGVVNGKGN
jgi:cytochrome c oxidase assembly protein Cox11